MLTLEEVKKYLQNIDEISLLELLEISSEDITDRFEDKIEDKFDLLIEEFEELNE